MNDYAALRATLAADTAERRRDLEERALVTLARAIVDRRSGGGSSPGLHRRTALLVLAQLAADPAADLEDLFPELWPTETELDALVRELRQLDTHIRSGFNTQAPPVPIAGDERPAWSTSRARRVYAGLREHLVDLGRAACEDIEERALVLLARGVADEIAGALPSGRPSDWTALRILSQLAADPTADVWWDEGREQLPSEAALTALIEAIGELDASYYEEVDIARFLVGWLYRDWARPRDAGLSGPALDRIADAGPLLHLFAVDAGLALGLRDRGADVVSLLDAQPSETGAARYGRLWGPLTTLVRGSVDELPADSAARSLLLTVRWLPEPAIRKALGAFRGNTLIVVGALRAPEQARLTGTAHDPGGWLADKWRLDEQIQGDGAPVTIWRRRPLLGTRTDPLVKLLAGGGLPPASVLRAVALAPLLDVLRGAVARCEAATAAALARLPRVGEHGLPREALARRLAEGITDRRAGPDHLDAAFTGAAAPHVHHLITMQRLRSLTLWWLQTFAAGRDGRLEWVRGRREPLDGGEASLFAIESEEALELAGGRPLADSVTWRFTLPDGDIVVFDSVVGLGFRTSSSPAPISGDQRPV